MPPLAIIGAAAAVGTGASIAANMSNAGAAKDAAAKNAAAITANQQDNAGLIDSQKAQNEGLYNDYRDTANGAALNAYTQNEKALFDTANRNFGYADTLQNSANQNADTLQGQGQGLYQGAVDRGNTAGASINALLGLSGDASAQNEAFQNWLGSTGYKFNLQTGSDAISSNAATRGLLNSGGTLKALNNYGQQTGQTYFGNYLSGLQGQQSTGLTAANALSGVYSNVASMRDAGAVDATNLRTSANNALSAGYTANQNLLASNTSGNAWNYAGGVASLNTNATNSLVSGNTASTNALVGNTNNALNATVSSNNGMANSISGLAGNLAGAYGYAQGTSSYGAKNPLSAPTTTSSSYQLPATGGMAA